MPFENMSSSSLSELSPKSSVVSSLVFRSIEPNHVLNPNGIISTIDLPIQQVSSVYHAQDATNTHAMHITSKSRVFKPKTYMLVTIMLEPFSIQEAFQVFEWNVSMQ